jgi:hypothetical protein
LRRALRSSLLPATSGASSKARRTTRRTTVHQ